MHPSATTSEAAARWIYEFVCFVLAAHKQVPDDDLSGLQKRGKGYIDGKAIQLFARGG